MSGAERRRMGRAEWRAVARLARRTAWREWRRTTLVAALVAVPVMVGIVTAGVVRANDLTAEERIRSEYGRASMKLSFSPGEGPAGDAADVDDADGAAPTDGGGRSEPVWFEGVEVVDTAVREVTGDDAALRVRNGWGPIGATAYGQVTDLDLTHPLAEGRLVLSDGSAPQGPDEVALSAPVMADVDADIGETFAWGDGTRVTVVGEVLAPTNVGDPVAVVHPDLLDTLTGDTASPSHDHRDAHAPVWFVGQVDEAEEFVRAVAARVAQASPVDLRLAGPGGARLGGQTMIAEEGDPTEAQPNRSPSLVVRFREQDVAMSDLGPTGMDRVLTPPVVATLVAAVLLAEVALIAGAAYATGARRRLRELGLLGANGATVGHVRAAVIGEATVTGIVGALAGMVTGLLALGFGRPVMQRFVTPQITRLELSTTDLVGPAVVAVVAVSLAAWLPARTAARVPTTTALEGRMPLSTPKRWIVPAGVALAGFGALLLLVGMLAGRSFGGVVAAAGVLFAIGGAAMLTVPIVAGVGRCAHRFPATMRLVLRDSARQRTRAAAASASAMVVLIAPVLIATLATTMDRQELVRGLPEPDTHVHAAPVERQLAQDGPATPHATVGDGDVGAAEDTREESLAAIRSELSDANHVRVTYLDERAVVPPGSGFVAGEPDSGFPGGALADDRGPEEQFWDTYGDQRTTHVALAAPDLLEALGDPAVTAAVEEQGAVVLGLDARSTTIEIAGTEVAATEAPTAVLRHGFPRVLVSQVVADNLDLAVAGTGDLFVADRPITDETRTTLYRNSVDIHVGTGPGNTKTVRWAAVGATLVVALVILALVTMLAATESDNDLRTMVAVGAAPRMRRRFLGLQASLHALVGAVLALPLAIALAYAVVRAETYVHRGVFGTVPPGSMWLDWPAMGLVLLAVPAAIGVGIALLVRSAPTVPPRRLG